MSLKDQLLPASFRGVAFQVKASSIKAGRRTVVHEYPQRDKPYVEDLGRATRQVTIDAFVVGTDYISQAQALLNAIEQEGSGTLIHPWLGEMQVTLSAVSELKFDTALGVATISFTATESGDLSFPKSGIDTLSGVLSSADTLTSSAISKFCDSIDTSVVSEYVHSALSGDLLDVLGVISNSDLAKAFDLEEGIADLISDGLSLISTDPKVFATTLAGSLGLSRWATTATAWTRVGKQIGNLVGNEKMSKGTKEWNEIKNETAGMSANVRAQKQNRAAIESLTRQILIAQMVGVSAVIGTDADKASASTAIPALGGESEEESISSFVGSTDSPKSYDEMIEARDTTMNALDEEMFLEGEDEAYQALEDARTAVFECLTERADTQSQMVTIVPADIFPALVLAYDYHDDANRDREIAVRNNVVREGFCPASDTKVLSA